MAKKKKLARKKGQPIFTVFLKCGSSLVFTAINANEDVKQRYESYLKKGQPTYSEGTYKVSGENTQIVINFEDVSAVTKKL